MKAIKTAVVIAVIFQCLIAVPAGAQDQPAGETTVQSEQAETEWPRQYAGGGNTVILYQPQIEKWEKNLLEARMAVSVQTAAAAQPTFGVVWFNARTEVNKESGLVTLEDIKIVKADFPQETEAGPDCLAIASGYILTSPHVISLARLEANLAVTQAEEQKKGVKAPLKNDPPRIIFSTTPAILVLIDGQPVLRQIEGTSLLRVINTRALLLLDQSSGKYYLHLLGQWMEAASIDGPWAVAQNPPAALETAKAAAVADKQVNLLDQEGDQTHGATTVPTVYVSTGPAELLQTQGLPGFAPIAGTQLLSVKNTSSRLFLDLSDQQYYVLISGRWFRAPSLTGPWEYVPAAALPSDFAQIPENHPQGDALMSVANTPQAKEAVIANSVPQTATVKRSEAKLNVVYDGKPEFKPIEETKLHYAVNTATPVIRVNNDSYYAVQNGVWFAAGSPTGPWEVASVVSGEIYTIPPSSPLYYVTYVHVYGSTPEVIYTGYQPGYLGTCVSEEEVVVYGTGYVYPPWVGTVWFGPPVTYGFGVDFGFVGGFTFGFAAGWWCDPWWGPYWGWPGWGGNVYVNNVNIYNHWSKNVIVPRNRPSIHPVHSGHTAHGDVYAGRDGKAYRRQDGNWHQYKGKDGWKPLETATEKKPEALTERRPEETARARGESSETRERLNQEEGARGCGEDREKFFTGGGGGGGFGGFHGGGRGGGFGRR